MIKISAQISLENAYHFEKKPEFLQSFQEEGKRNKRGGYPPLAEWLKEDACKSILSLFFFSWAPHIKPI